MSTLGEDHKVGAKPIILFFILIWQPLIREVLNTGMWLVLYRQNQQNHCTKRTQNNNIYMGSFLYNIKVILGNFYSQYECILVLIYYRSHWASTIYWLSIEKIVQCFVGLIFIINLNYAIFLRQKFSQITVCDLGTTTPHQ